MIRFTIVSHQHAIGSSAMANAGYIFQFLGHILAKLAQLAAAGGAFLADTKHRLVARQMARQRTAPGLAFLFRGRRVVLARRSLRRPRDLFFFQRQFKLIEAFRASAELMPAQPRELVLELLDQEVAGLQLGIAAR